MRKQRRAKVTCEGCGLVFTPGWSKEEALAEAAELHGLTPEQCADPEETGICCDDCHNELQEWIAEGGDEYILENAAYFKRQLLIMAMAGMDRPKPETPIGRALDLFTTP